MASKPLGRGSSRTLPLLKSWWMMGWGFHWCRNLRPHHLLANGDDISCPALPFLTPCTGWWASACASLTPSPPLPCGSNEQNLGWHSLPTMVISHVGEDHLIKMFCSQSEAPELATLTSPHPPTQILTGHHHAPQARVQLQDWGGGGFFFS